MPIPLGESSKVDVKTVRVAFLTDGGGGVETDDDTRQAVVSAAQALSDAGASVTEARPTGFVAGYDLKKAVNHADGGVGVRRLLEEAGTTETHALIRWLQDLDEASALSGPELADLLARLDT